MSDCRSPLEMMYFPDTTVISDDAQFFFEDYNYYPYNYSSRPVDHRIEEQAQSGPDHLSQSNTFHQTSFPSCAQQASSDWSHRPGPAGFDYRSLSTLICEVIKDDNEQDHNQCGMADHVTMPQMVQRADTNTVSSSQEDTNQNSSNSSKSTLNGNKVCRVCGDKALGYNFNVVSCESCKAFFRRNALKKKKLQCPFNNTCNITVSSRRYCQKCRLRTCLEVGMKAEYIMTEEQRARKRLRLLERDSPDESSTAGTPAPQEPPPFSSPPPSPIKKLRPMNSTVECYNMVSPKLENDNEQRDNTNRETPAKSICIPISPALDVSQQTIQIPSDQLSSPPTVPTFSTPRPTVDTEDDKITLQISKSALLAALCNNGESSGRMRTVIEAVVGWGSQSGGSTCTCPCNCTANRTRPNPPSTSDASSGWTMGPEKGVVMRPDTSKIGRGADGPNEHPLDLTNTRPRHPPTDQGPPGSLFASIFTRLDSEMLASLSRAFHIDWDNTGNYQTKLERLGELLMADEAWTERAEWPPLRGTNAADFTREDFYNLVHNTMRGCIRQIKRLYAFQALSIEDQCALMKGGLRDLFVIRAISKYDSKTDRINAQYPGREYISLDITKRIRGGVYDQTKQLIASYPEKWRTDRTLMLILEALVIFDPTRPSVGNMRMVDTQRQVYGQLLTDYIQGVYGNVEAREGSVYLIEQVLKLSHWAKDNTARVLIELDPRTLEPVLMEVLDFQ